MLPEKITRDWVEERLDTLHPRHVAAFVRLLTELRALFDGDLDAMLVLAAVTADVERDEWRQTLLDTAEGQGTQTPANALSIALSTGIPRETVRRKLAKLEDMKVAQKDARGHWSATPQAAEILRPGTLASMTYIKKILNAALEAERAQRQAKARKSGAG
mgnify:FL=1|jgi:hypothetical protein